MAHRKPEKEVICPLCGKPFIRKHRNRKYCESCSKDVWRKQSLASYYKRRGARPVLKKVCPYCKAPFKTILGRKLYCTPEHKIWAERARRMTPEGREKRRAEHIKYKAKAMKKKKHNAYMRKYYQEVIKPRKLAAAKLPPKRSKLFPISLIRMTPEQMVKNWDRIV